MTNDDKITINNELSVSKVKLCTKEIKISDKNKFIPIKNERDQNYYYLTNILDENSLGRTKIQDGKDNTIKSSLKNNTLIKLINDFKCSLIKENRFKIAFPSNAIIDTIEIQSDDDEKNIFLILLLIQSNRMIILLLKIY